MSHWGSDFVRVEEKIQCDRKLCLEAVSGTSWLQPKMAISDSAFNHTEKCRGPYRGRE